MLIDDGINKFLTDPWFISPAFGTWYQYPSPIYDDLQKISKVQEQIFTVISHGHDDHIDDFFVGNYLNNSQIIISKFKSKGFFKRVSALSAKKPIEIDQDFSKPLKVNNNFLYSYSNNGYDDDSVILITNEKEVIIHANDNHAEISEKTVNAIRKISENKKIYYFGQIGVGSAFPAGYPNLSVDKRKEVIRSIHKRLVNVFEKNTDKIRPDLAFAYANQYRFDQKDSLCYYDDAQDLLSGHSFIKQLQPGDRIVNGKLIKNQDTYINCFDKLLQNLEDCTNNYVQKKIKTNFKLNFRVIENRFDKDRVIPKASPNHIFFATDKATWSSIIAGKLNLETVLIGGNGDIVKVHEENMRDVGMCVSEFAYVYQNRNTKNLF